MLVTGANAGIGLELSRQYAASGWAVIATHRLHPARLARRTRPDGSRTCRVARMDVTSEADVQDAGREAPRATDRCPDQQRRHLRGQSGLEYAGIRRRLGYKLGATMMITNVLGPLLVSEAFARQRRRQRPEEVISITSTHASVTQPIKKAAARFFIAPARRPSTARCGSSRIR